ncbi:ATPase synthesis protein 25 mitochondrial [Zalaria obscura]|uniref:ATPase synthesis protein 25 mitochondrial n=1 Tax=Zalaria obscura TaxID=2024903 RepID=A0ACC3SM10_9PEZI
MSLPRAVRGALASAAGVSTTLPDRSRPWQALRAPPRASAFSSRADSLPGQELDITENLPSELNESKEASTQPSNDNSPVAAQSPPPQQNAVPWYLQVDSPTPQQDHPLSARQQLPELPPSPPPLLQPILEHVSVELGLDDLSLLDLRALDPPPALGANLIMIEPDEAEKPQAEAPKKTIEGPKMPQAEEPRMFESPSHQGGPRIPTTSGSSHFMPFNGPSQQGAQQSRGFSTFTDIGTEPFSKSYKRKFRARELERNTEQQLQQADLSASTLRKLLDVLKSMDPDSAFDALGKDSEDTTSTDFLVAFHQAMPDFPRARHWHLHTELSCFGLELGHPGYTPELLVSHIESMHHACITPSRATYHMILETLLPPSGLLYQEDTGGDPSYRLHTDAVKIVMDILDNIPTGRISGESGLPSHAASYPARRSCIVSSSTQWPRRAIRMPASRH